MDSLAGELSAEFRKAIEECAMIAPEPIKLPDIDEYLEDLTAAIAETANMALNLCLRARMAVSAGAQEIAYVHLAQVGTLLAKIYQAGDASEIDLSFLP